MLHKKAKDALNILLIFAVIIFFGRILLPIINSPGFTQFVADMGRLGPLIVIFYVVLAHVFAPLVGSPMLFVSAAIYGLGYSTIYFYIGGLFSSAINFWIARKYGRKWVIKLAGKSAMKDIDNFVAVEGTEVLVISRIFGFPLFDFISYAAGLTKIDFKKYYFITNFIGLFTGTFIYFIYRNVDLKTEEGTALWMGSLLAVAFIFTFAIRHYLDKKVSGKK